MERSHEAGSQKASVCLAGLGNIGFRHLQGLTSIASSTRVIGVDPSAEARQRSLDEWKNVTGSEFETQGNLAGPIDCLIAIIATCATNRLDILKQIVGATGAKQIVLEKVAFPKLEDFDAAKAIASTAGAAVYVNCPRRMWPLYQGLKKTGLGQQKDFSLRMRWRNFGLACNSVHFIDLLQFLTDSSAVKVVSSDLDRIVLAKRDGYFEVIGVLRFESQTGGELVIDVSDSSPETPEITLTAGGVEYHINEQTGVVQTSDGNRLIEAGRCPFQSELTGALVTSILDGTPNLAGLRESKEAHASLFKALVPFFKKAGVETTAGLPIT